MAELGQVLLAGIGAARRLRPGRGRRDLQAEAVGIVPQLRAAGGRTAEEVPHADADLAVRGQRPQLVQAARHIVPALIQRQQHHGQLLGGGGFLGSGAKV